MHPTCHEVPQQYSDHFTFPLWILVSSRVIQPRESPDERAVVNLNEEFVPDN
jgi:hypothetical protein